MEAEKHREHMAELHAGAGDDLGQKRIARQEQRRKQAGRNGLTKVDEHHDQRHGAAVGAQEICQSGVSAAVGANVLMLDQPRDQNRAV